MSQDTHSWPDYIIKVYDFRASWFDRFVDFENFVVQNLCFCARFGRPWDALCADLVPTHYTVTTRTKKNRNRNNFSKKMQQRDDFCDKMCTADSPWQNDRAECVESAAGRAPWGAQNVYSLYSHHTSKKKQKIWTFLEKCQKQRDSLWGRIECAARGSRGGRHNWPTSV